MLKTRRKSIRHQPAEITQASGKFPDIVGHYDYVDKLLEWSLNDLDHLMLTIQHRIAAEQVYVNALADIKNLPPPPTIDVLPFEGELTFTTAKTKFKTNLDRTINDRVHLVETMTSQLDVLKILKKEQEKKRSKIKTSLATRNTEYLMQRSTALPRQRKIYRAKCAELEQEESANNAMIATATTTATASEEIGSPISSSTETATPVEKAEKRKSRASLQTIRQHLASRTSPVDQNNKIAKLKHEVMEADRNYRLGVATLERLREEQIDMAKRVHDHIKVMFMDKTEITKSVLRYIFVTEQTIQTREATMLQALTKTCDEMDGRKDMAAFSLRINNLKFAPPDPTYYEHYKHGQLKDAQFGISLEMYSKAHSNRTVPVLVSRCIEAVEEMGGLQREGIYRISGRHASVDALRLEFEKDEQLCDIKQFDLFTIASVLKVFLRELEVPLWAFPMNLRDDHSKKDDTTRLRELETRIGDLTPPHRETLRVIIEHLARISAQADKNRMTIPNLSVIFTPAIFHDEQQSQSGHDRVLVDLITYHKSLFDKYNNGDSELMVQEKAGPTPSNPTVNPTANSARPVAAEGAQQRQPKQLDDAPKGTDLGIAQQSPIPSDQPNS